MSQIQKILTSIKKFMDDSDVFSDNFKIEVNALAYKVANNLLLDFSEQVNILDGLQLFLKDSQNLNIESNNLFELLANSINSTNSIITDAEHLEKTKNALVKFQFSQDKFKFSELLQEINKILNKTDKEPSTATTFSKITNKVTQIVRKQPPLESDNILPEKLKIEAKYLMDKTAKSNELALQGQINILEVLLKFLKKFQTSANKENTLTEQLSEFINHDLSKSDKNLSELAKEALDKYKYQERKETEIKTQKLKEDNEIEEKTNKQNIVVTHRGRTISNIRKSRRMQNKSSLGSSSIEANANLQLPPVIYPASDVTNTVLIEEAQTNITNLTNLTNANNTNQQLPITNLSAESNPINITLVDTTTQLPVIIQEITELDEVCKQQELLEKAELEAKHHQAEQEKAHKLEEEARKQKEETDRQEEFRKQHEEQDAKVDLEKAQQEEDETILNTIKGLFILDKKISKIYSNLEDTEKTTVAHCVSELLKANNQTINLTGITDEMRAIVQQVAIISRLKVKCFQAQTHLVAEINKHSIQEINSAKKENVLNLMQAKAAENNFDINTQGIAKKYMIFQKGLEKLSNDKVEPIERIRNFNNHLLDGNNQETLKLARDPALLRVVRTMAFIAAGILSAGAGFLIAYMVTGSPIGAKPKSAKTADDCTKKANKFLKDQPVIAIARP